MCMAGSNTAHNIALLKKSRYSPTKSFYTMKFLFKLEKSDQVLISVVVSETKLSLIV